MDDLTHTVTCSWVEGMAFDSTVAGHTIRLDGDESVGGSDSGPRPKPLLLSALAGCTGMDVIYILRKMKIEPSFFNIDVNGRLGTEHPVRYEEIDITYEFKNADDLDTHKVETAIKLSQEKYCGVSAMLKDVSKLTYTIEYV